MFAAVWMRTSENQATKSTVRSGRGQKNSFSCVNTPSVGQCLTKLADI